MVDRRRPEPVTTAGPLPAGLRGALSLLVLAGLVALHLAGVVGPLGLGLTAALVGASWWAGRLADALATHPWVGRALIAVAGLAAAVYLLWLAETALDGFVHVLVVLVLMRLCALRSARDVRVVAYLSFFMPVAASASTLGVGFLLVFVVFVVLGTWVLLFQQAVAELEEGRHRAVVGGAGLIEPGRGLAMLGLGAALAALVVAGALFFIIPRIGQAALPLRTRVGPLVTGFSDRVTLGATGQIETDSTVIMRVNVATVGAQATSPALRWRGIVFDHFDGQAWTVGTARRVSVRRSPPGQYVLGAPRGSGTALVQEIYLEPLGTDLLFVAPNLLHLELPSDRIVVDDMGSVSVGSGPARLHYIAISEVGDAGRGVLATGPDRLGPEERRRYLQLPPLAARIENLARQVGGAPREPYEMARRLSQYLSSEFEYTLTLTRRTTLDPLEEFLFVRRSGNCEYFAAALAVMLRSQGMPARVVGGFQQGEWNAYGHYFMVRLRDAHAWVEAHVDGVGWVTFDPSPRRVPLTPGAIALYLDALRMRWYRYVINWSLRDQIEVAALIRHHASGWRPGTAALREWEAPRPSPLLLAPLAAAVVVALGLWRLTSRRRPGVGRGRLPWFYARALSVLAGRGLQPWPGETAREFCARAGAALPGVAAPLARITAEYECCRFGGRPPGPTETAAINRWLGVLARDDLPSQGGSSAR